MIKRPLVFLLALVLVLVVGAAVAVAGDYWWLNRGPDHPDEWDSRVDDLVEFVEDERGLEFEHPVYIDFLSEEDFEKEVTSEEPDLTDEEKEALDKDEAVDELFEDPPVTEEHLLDPWTLIDGDQDAISVDKPDLEEGEEEFDDGTFGSPSLLFVLAERIDVQQALKAADGWGGDQYVAFERAKRSCIRVDYLGDTQRDVAELRGALKQWIADGPSGIASVRDHEDGLRFESCDPGREAVGGNGGSQAALELAVGRTTLATQGMQQGATEEQARCFASEVVRAFTIDDLEELNTAEPDPALIERVQTLAIGCR